MQEGSGKKWQWLEEETGCEPKAGESREQGTFGGMSWLPLQYSCLENPMDGRAWQGTITKSQT